MRRSSYAPFLLINSLLVMSCTATTPPVPPQIDLLQRYPVHVMQVEGHRLAYLDIGQGPPVILLHGFGGSMWHWEQQQTALAKTHRLITLDLPGSGLSDKPEIDYSPALLLNFMTQFMNRLHIQNATFVGNSLGAGIAIGMASTHPQRVNKLVLIGGFPAKVVESISSPSYRRFVEHRLPLWLAKIGLRLAGRWATEKILREIIYDPTLITPTIIERSYRNRSDSGFLHPLYSLIDHLDEWENRFATHFGEIPHPTLILWGSKDRIFPPLIGHQIRTAIAHARILEIPDAGHLPQWEKPQVVNEILLEFLDPI